MEEGSRLLAWALNLAYAGGTLCAGALFLLYLFQDKLLYYPTIPGAPKLTKDNPRGAQTACIPADILPRLMLNWWEFGQATATRASTASTMKT